MTGLPRPQVRPLPPDPEAFDAVLARSRTRRHRRVATTCAAAVTGVALVGGGVGASGAATALFNLADPVPASTTREQPRPAVTPTPTPAQQPTPSPTSSPETTEDSPGQGGQAVAPPPATHRAAPALLRGVVEDESGTPVEGAYVYRLRRVDGGLHLRDAPTRTDALGRYQLSCADGPVVVAPWPLVERQPTAEPADRGWAARYVSGEQTPTCRHTRVRTVVRAGSAVTGTFTYPDACPHEFTGLLRVRVLGEIDISVALGPLEPGTGFRIAGLPPGDHLLKSGPTELPFRIEDRGTTLTLDLHATMCRAGDNSAPYKLYEPPPTGEPTSGPTESAGPGGGGSGGSGELVE